MTLLRVTSAFEAYGIVTVDVTKNQNGVRTALNNVTLVRPVICRSMYMYPCGEFNNVSARASALLLIPCFTLFASK